MNSLYERSIILADSPANNQQQYTDWTKGTNSVLFLFKIPIHFQSVAVAVAVT